MLFRSLRDPRSVERLFAQVKKRFHRLDVLVNNAGIAHPLHEVARLPVKAWQEVIATNLTGMFLATRAALPLLRSGGVIVNNLSISARQVFPRNAAYDASKHGALGFTKALREELRPRGIRVIALLPGATDTAIWRQFWPSAPRHRMISPDTVAATVAHAVSLPANAVLEELVVTPIFGAL